MPADPPRPFACRRGPHYVGVRNLCLSFSSGPDPARYVQRFGEEVLPAFAN